MPLCAFWQRSIEHESTAAGDEDVHDVVDRGRSTSRPAMNLCKMLAMKVC